MSERARSLSRTLWLLSLGLGGWACSPDDGASPTPVASVGGAQLTVDRFSELLVLAQPLPLEPEVARGLARTWVDLTVVTTAIAAGDSLTHPDQIREGTWLRRRAALIARESERARPAPPIVTPAMADSVYREGDIRLVAHVLRRADETMSEEDQRAQGESAAQILAYLREGGFWEDANERSEDPEARANGGILGVFARGRTPQGFDRTVFSLAPGQLSDVVRTTLGFHILYRPRFEEVAGRFAQDLQTFLLMRQDSLVRETMLREHGVTFTSDAAAVVRAATADPWAHTGDTTVLARHPAGVFTMSELARYLVYLGRESRGEMTGAPDRELLRFLRRLVQEDLLWRRSERAGPLAEDIRETLVTEYVEAVGELARQLGPAVLEGTPAGDPGAVAAVAVNAYLEDVVARKVDLVAVPPFVSVPLLLDMEWSIDSEALVEALARAARLVEATTEGS